MLLDLRDGEPLLHITIQHRLYELYRRLRHDPRDPELMVQDLVDAVEGVFLVDEGVEEDSQRPDVLFFASVRFTL